tara:strand:+ start:1800 stop:3254 length:1455 start_codon:yes stop_codon:yes gene_type:complete
MIKSSFLFVFLSCLFVSATWAQEVEDPYHMERVNARISNAYHSLLNANDGDPQMDCYRRDIVSGLEEATWLWEDISDVLNSGDTVEEESSLFDIVFNNFDRLLDFSKYFNVNTNDPNLLGSGIYTLYTFAELVNENSPETHIDQETMLGLLNIITNEPFNLILPDAVFSLVQNIESLEVETIQRGDLAGEIRIKIHTINNRKIRMGVDEFMEEGAPNDTPFSNLIIDNEASFTFRASDNRDRDRRIMNLLDRTQTTSDSDLRELGQQSAETWLNSLSDREATNQRFSNPGSAMNAYVTQGTSPEASERLTERYNRIVGSLYQISPDASMVLELQNRINEMQNRSPDEIEREFLQGILLQVSQENRDRIINEVVNFSGDLRSEMVSYKTTRRPEMSNSDLQTMRDFVTNREYEGRDNAAPPLHFTADGVRASFKRIGAIAGVKISEGAITPGARNEDPLDRNNSIVIKAGGTGIAALAGSQVLGM